jgi:hypothetical protein
VGRIWERLARQGRSRHAYRRAIDAFSGAITIDPRGAREDSSDMRRVRLEAAAPQLR